MKRCSAFWLALIIPVLSACAAQPAPDEAESSAAVTAGETDQEAENVLGEPDPNEVICRREQVSGTNFRRLVCMTRAEREAMREESQEDFIERRSRRR